jgi:isochorismate synthase
MENNQSETSFALCRLPNETDIFVFKGKEAHFASLDQLHDQVSFVICPYHKTPSFISIPYSHKSTAQEIEFPSHFIFKEKDVNDTSQEHYKQIVQTAVNAMKENAYSKIVLATNTNKELNSFDPSSFFQSLLNDYPTAFVYCISSPETGTWFGASPEPLLVGNGTQFNTIALAGTMPIEKEGMEWGEKEKQEQKLVETYIEETLSAYSNHVTLVGPNTKKAGNLIHLATNFHFELTQGNVNDLILELHPTPAIAGLPKKIAIEEIEKLENFSRSYYAGLLGIYSKDFVQLYVNLRCMEWHQNTATLYAGAGITADSDPQAEWNETRKKILSLGKFL